MANPKDPASQNDIPTLTGLSTELGINLDEVGFETLNTFLDKIQSEDPQQIESATEGLELLINAHESDTGRSYDQLLDFFTKVIDHLTEALKSGAPLDTSYENLLKVLERIQLSKANNESLANGISNSLFNLAKVLQTQGQASFLNNFLNDMATNPTGLTAESELKIVELTLKDADAKRLLNNGFIERLIYTNLENDTLGIIPQELQALAPEYAKCIIDLITSNALSLNKLNNILIKFSGAEFLEVFTSKLVASPDQQYLDSTKQKFRELVLSLQKNVELDNPIFSNLKKIVFELFGEEFANELLEYNTKGLKLEQLADSLNDQELSLEQKHQVLKDVLKLLEEEKRKDSPDDRVLKKVFGIVLGNFRRLNLADAESYKIDSYGRTLTTVAIELYKNSFETGRPEARILGNTGTLAIVENKIIDGLKLLKEDRVDYSGIQELYLILIDNPDVYAAFPAVHSQIFENIAFALPNQTALRLLKRLYTKLTGIDEVEDILQFDQITTVDQVRAKQDALQEIPIGEFISWIAFRSDESADELLDKLQGREGDSTIAELIELINVIRPEIRQKFDERAYERREKRTDSIKSRIGESLAAVRIEMITDSIKRDELKKLELQRTWKEKAVHGIESTLSFGRFKFNKFRTEWRKGIDEKLKENVQEESKRQKKMIVEVGVDSLLEVIKANSSQYRYDADFIYVLSDSKTRNQFEAILIELYKLYSDEEYASLRPKIAQIFESYSLDHNVLEFLSPELRAVRIPLLKAKLETYQNKYADFLGEELRVEEIEGNRIASIRLKLRGELTKKQEEQKLSEQYLEVAKPRNIAIKELEIILSDKRLYDIYIDTPGFEDLLVSTIDSLVASGLRSSYDVGFIMYLIQETNSLGHSIWDSLPAQTRLKAAETLLSSFTEGTQEYRKIVLKLLKNPTPPPAFVRSDFSNYLSAVYIYAQETNAEFRNKIQIVLEEEPVSTKRRLFSRKKEENPRNEFLSEFDQLDNFLNGPDAVTNPKVIGYLAAIRRESRLHQKNLANRQAVNELVTTNADNISQIQTVLNPDNNIFTKEAATVIPQLDSAEKLFNKLNEKNNREVFVQGIINVDQANIENLTKVISSLINLYYLLMFFKKDAALKTCEEIMRFVTDVINSASERPDFFTNDLKSLLEQKAKQYVPIIRDSETADATVVVAQLSTDINNSAESVNNYEINRMSMITFNRIKSVNELIKNGEVTSRSRVLTLLASVEDTLGNLDEETIKILLKKLVEGDNNKKVFQEFIANLFIYMYHCQRWSVIQGSIEHLFEILIKAVSKDTLFALENIEQVIDSCIEKFTKRSARGRTIKVANIPNKFLDGRFEKMRNTITKVRTKAA